MQAVARIRNLLINLPSRDRELGQSFLCVRDFESLKELIDSAIYKTKKNLMAEEPKEEYLNVDMTELSILKSEVDVYLAQLNIPIAGREEEDEEEY